MKNSENAVISVNNIIKKNLNREIIKIPVNQDMLQQNCLPPVKSVCNNIYVNEPKFSYKRYVLNFTCLSQLAQSMHMPRYFYKYM